MSDRLSHPDFVDLTREDLTDMELISFRSALEDLVNQRVHLDKVKTELLTDIYLSAKKLLEGIH